MYVKYKLGLWLM